MTPSRDEGGPIQPRYGGQSLLNVPASVCALNMPWTGLAPPLDATVLAGLIDAFARPS